MATSSQIASFTPFFNLDAIALELEFRVRRTLTKMELADISRV
jgi:hypothetical protein